MILIFFYPVFYSQFFFCSQHHLLQTIEQDITLRLLPSVRMKRHGNEMYIVKDSLLELMFEMNEWNLMNGATLHFLKDYSRFEKEPNIWYPLTDFMTSDGEIHEIISNSREYQYIIPRDSRISPTLQVRDKIGYSNGKKSSNSSKYSKARNTDIVGVWTDVNTEGSERGIQLPIGVPSPVVKGGTKSEKKKRKRDRHRVNHKSVPLALLFQFQARPAAIEAIVRQYHRKVADVPANAAVDMDLRLHMEHLGQEGVYSQWGTYNHHPNRTHVVAASYNYKLRGCWVLNSKKTKKRKR